MSADQHIALAPPPPPEPLRQDLLYRLRWNVFGPLEDIQVVDADSTLSPFSSHAIAAESVARPPLARLSVYIDTCEEQATHDEGDGGPGSYDCPEHLVIEAEDGECVTLAEFVAQTHAYLNEHRENIMECEDEMYTPGANNGVWEVRVDDVGDNIPGNAGFWFDYAGGYEIEGEGLGVYVTLFVEGNEGKTLGEWVVEREKDIVDAGEGWMKQVERKDESESDDEDADG